jgi:hypothetical protein
MDLPPTRWAAPVNTQFVIAIFNRLMSQQGFYKTSTPHA